MTASAQQLQLLSFLQECKDHPGDDTPRLVFADWLEEQDDRRGTLIRIQCALAQSHPLDPRQAALRQQEQDLLRQHGEEWLGPYQGLPGKVSFERGLLRLDFRPEEYPGRANPPTLSAAERAWLDELHLGERTPDLALQQLEGLLECFSGVTLNNAPRYGVDSSNWPAGLSFRNLRRLNLDWCRIEDAGAEFLASNPGLVNLTHLSLACNSLTAAGVFSLAMAPWFPQLCSLNLSNNKIQDAGLRHLLTRPLPHLRGLDVSDNDIHEEGVARLARSGLLTRLTSLNLGGSPAGTIDVWPLLDHTGPGQFHSLRLRDTRLDDERLVALASSPLLARLRTLELGTNAIGRRGALALASSPYLRNLAYLDLSYNRLEDTPLSVWVNSSSLPGLRVLHLGNNRIGDKACLDLDEAAVRGPLAALILRRNGIGDEGLTHLLRSPLLGQLALLDLSSNQLRTLGARRIAETEAMSAVKILHVDNNEIGDEGAQALAASPHLGGLERLHARGNKILGDGRRVLPLRFGERVEV